MLERIARHNPPLNAIVVLAADAALARARGDEARARRESWGPFHGVPITIKDTFEVAGVTTTAGSASLRSHVPSRDAAVVARLKGAGAIVLGKTNVPIFASDWQSYNAVYGQSNNPWDVARTPGGSTRRRGRRAGRGAQLISSPAAIWRARSASRPTSAVSTATSPRSTLCRCAGTSAPPPGISAAPPSTLPVAGPLARSAADLLAVLEVLGRARRRRSARLAVVAAACARRAARRLPHRLHVGRSARAGLAGGSRVGRVGGGAAEGGGAARGRLAARRERGGAVRRLPDPALRALHAACAPRTSFPACVSSPPTRTDRISPGTPARSPPRTRICRPSRRAAAWRAVSGRHTSAPTTPS